MLSFPKTFLALGLLSLTFANVAQAALIELNADHFSVTYDDAQVGPYKQGLLSGSLDTVYFQPTTFAALSGGNPVTTQASLQLTLTINPGYVFTGLSFTEWGDYFLSDGGTVDVAASVQAVNNATSDFAILSLSPGMPLGQTGESTDWELAGNLSLLGLGSPQTLLITLNNELSSTPVDGIGFIQKTYAGFRIMTAPAAVPEPSSWALLLAGLAAARLAGRGRRRPSHGIR